MLCVIECVLMGVCVCLGITCVLYVIIKMSAFCFSRPVIVIGVLFGNGPFVCE